MTPKLKVRRVKSLTITVFSLTHKFKGPCVSDSLKNLLNGNAERDCLSWLCNDDDDETHVDYFSKHNTLCTFTCLMYHC